MIDRRAFLAGAAAAALIAAPSTVWGQRFNNLPRIALTDQAEALAAMNMDHPRWGAFLRELARRGYVEGQTAVIERWSAEGRAAAGVAKMVAAVVNSRPDVIVARGRRLIDPIMEATRTIPIVGSGTFQPQINFARPGRNLTGVSGTIGGKLFTKMLQFLHDAVPTASRIAVLGPRNFWTDQGGPVREGAEQLGLVLVPVFVDEPVTEATARQTIASMPSLDIDGVYVAPSNQIYAHRAAVAAEILAIGLPAIAYQGGYSGLGLLMSYSPDGAEIYRRLADYVDRILKGADPAEMPIEQPTRFDFIVNLKTTRELGITLPPAILIQATELIE